MPARKSLSPGSKASDPSMMAPQHTLSKSGSAAALALRLDGALLKLTAAMAIAGICALIVAVAVVVGDIIWRRVGGGSFIGAVDLTQFSVMIAVSWSIPYAFATGSHVTVDLLSEAYSPNATRWLDIFASLTGALIAGFLGWLSAGRAWEILGYGDVSQDLAIPMILFWGFLVSGLAMSVVVCVVRMANLFSLRTL